MSFQWIVDMAESISINKKKMIGQTTTSVSIGTINGAGTWVDSIYVAIGIFR